MRKSILAMATAAAIAAFLPMLLVGCSSTTNANENINATARGASNDNAVGSANSNISESGDQNQNKESSLIDPAELGVESAFEAFDDVAEEDLKVADPIAIPKNETREYSGWYKVAFPKDMSADEYEDYFEYWESDDTVYYVEFECDKFVDADELAEEDDLEEEIAITAKSARELAEQTAFEEEGKMTDVQIGARTWYVVAFEDLDETYCFTDVAEGEYACIWFAGIPLASPDAQSIVSSFEVLPGDPYQNFQTWNAAHFG